METSQSKRNITGVFILIFVNLIWVLSSELTNYIFIAERFNKSFLVTYLKCSLFSFLLFGFLCSTHWKKISCPQKYGNSGFNDEQTGDALSEPSYVLINYDSSGDEDHQNSDDAYILVNPKKEERNQRSINASKRSVKFCKYKEVRRLSDTYAEESLAARMSYNASRILKKRLLIEKIIDQGFFPAAYIMKFAIQFSFFWFIANYAYQKCLATTIPSAINIISSASSLFILILTTIFPNSTKDKFNITYLSVIFLSSSGMILINVTEFSRNSKFHYDGIIWSLVAALGYAISLVNLRLNVKNESQISIVMFFGFVGLWSFVALWPALFVLGWSHVEDFEMPSGAQLGIILVNGVVGTVGAGLLWIWGSFLTSSITATMSMGLTIPLTIATDFFIKKKVHSWVPYVGSIPIIVSFLIVAYLSNNSGPSRDPLGTVIRHMLFTRLSRPRYVLLSDNDSNNDHTSVNNYARDMIRDSDRLLINESGSDSVQCD